MILYLVFLPIYILTLILTPFFLFQAILRLEGAKSWRSAQVRAVKQARAEVSETKNTAMFTSLRQDQLTGATVETQVDAIVELKAEVCQHLTRINELILERDSALG